MCAKQRVVTIAAVVDHIIPHKGDMRLFWNPNNWQPLCKLHHDSDKKIIEAGGRPKQLIGADGWPIDHDPL
jgi:5-methylcytosine-specific restriction endonuclease McrA